MDKLKIAPPDIHRKKDEVYVCLRCGLHHVTVKRTRPYYPFGIKPTPFSKAVISWNGGNGNETLPSATVFAKMILWATRIARNLNHSARPDALTANAILYKSSPVDQRAERQVMEA